MATRREVNKNNIVNDIKIAAIKYKNNLVGKTFLYVFNGKFIEVIFKVVSFKHLTGVDSNLGADQFYRNACNSKLSNKNVFFNKDHPFKLCEKKIKHIKDLSELALGESFMLEEVTTNTHVYKFGTTDTKFTLLLDADLDELGNIKSEKYVVKSLRDEDCFNKAKNAFSITHIFSKPNDSKIYDTLIYFDKNCKELPDDVVSMLSETLKANIS